MSCPIVLLWDFYLILRYLWIIFQKFPIVTYAPLPWQIYSSVSHSAMISEKLFKSFARHNITMFELLARHQGNRGREGRLNVFLSESFYATKNVKIVLAINYNIMHFDFCQNFWLFVLMQNINYFTILIPSWV